MDRMHNAILCQIEGQNVYLLYILPLVIITLHFSQCPQNLHTKEIDLLSLIFEWEIKHYIYDKVLMHVKKKEHSKINFHIVAGQIGLPPNKDQKNRSSWSMWK